MASFHVSKKKRMGFVEIVLWYCYGWHWTNKCIPSIDMWDNSVMRVSRLLDTIWTLDLWRSFFKRFSNTLVSPPESTRATSVYVWPRFYWHSFISVSTTIITLEKPFSNLSHSLILVFSCKYSLLEQSHKSRYKSFAYL